MAEGCGSGCSRIRARIRVETAVGIAAGTAIKTKARGLYESACRLCRVADKTPVRNRAASSKDSSPRVASRVEVVVCSSVSRHAGR